MNQPFLVHTAVMLTVAAGFGTDSQCSHGDNKQSAIESFLSQVAAFHDKNKSTPASERNLKLKELIATEAKVMRRYVPGILNDLGLMLRQREKDESRLDDLVRLEHPTDIELEEMIVLLDKREKSVKTPRCEIAYLISELADGAEERAIGELLAAVPLPERVEDSCVVRALMMIGPEGYKHIADRLMQERSPERIHVAVLALIAPTRDTDFPEWAGLGSEDNWDETVPTSTRGARRLARKWREWWESRGAGLSWDEETGYLLD